MKIVAAYIRVSTEEQVEYSPDSQLQELKNYASRHDMVIDPAHIYIDAGISGRTAKKRPSFQKMISVAKSKPAPFDAVLVWKYSRFARNQEESILYKSLLKRECGIDVVSITEETGDNMFGGLIERIIEWMDEFYSVRLSEEVKTKMTFVAETGKVQTIAPYGYIKLPGEEMVINEEEAKWIRFIFNQAEEGKSFLSIAKQLNAIGQRTHRGGGFENRTIEYILHNPMYKGYVRWTPTGKTLSRRIYDSPDTMTVKGSFAPIISEEQFEKVKEIMAEKKRKRKKNEQPTEVKKHYLSGIVKCSSCGSSLSYSPTNDGFQCYKYAKGTCTTSHFVTSSKLEHAIIDAIERVTVDDDFIILACKEPQVAVDYSAEHKKLDAMLSRAKSAYVSGIDTLEEYAENKKKIETKIKELKAKETEHRKEIKHPPKEDVEKMLSSVIAVLKSDSSKESKINAIKTIVDHAVYNKAESTVSLYFSI